MGMPCARAGNLVEPLRETLGARAVRLSHLAPVFARMADGMLLGWRRSLGVPDQATPEVEAELTALRRMFDEQFLPEFQAFYAAVLEQHLGAGCSGVLDALENADVQAYLAVVENVEAELAAVLRGYLPRAQAALSPAASTG
jgi:hypothetical protein